MTPDRKTVPAARRDHIPLFIDLSRWDLDIETLDDYVRSEARRLGANEFAVK